MNKSELVDGAEYEWKVGDRVEWDDAQNGSRRARGNPPDVLRGTITTHYAQDDRLAVTRDDGEHNGYGCWFVDRGIARPVSSPPAIAEKDRLFETGCCLCGAEECAPGVRFDGTSGSMGPQRLNPGADVCSACIGEKSTNEQWDAADAEITRRKGLAASTQPPTSPSTKEPTIAWDNRCCECGNLRTAHLVGCSRSKPANKPDPYAAHNANHDEDVIAARTADRDRRDTDRQRQAFRELDRGIKGPKYKYADSSVVFSTATWESD
jgi:hypothetical protein